MESSYCDSKCCALAADLLPGDLSLRPYLGLGHVQRRENPSRGFRPRGMARIGQRAGGDDRAALPSAVRWGRGAARRDATVCTRQVRCVTAAQPPHSPDRCATRRRLRGVSSRQTTSCSAPARKARLLPCTRGARTRSVTVLPGSGCVVQFLDFVLTPVWLRSCQYLSP